MAEKKYIIEITATDVALLGNGLGNLPYVQVVDLMQRLQSQLSEQDKPVEKVDTE